MGTTAMEVLETTARPRTLFEIGAQLRMALDIVDEGGELTPVLEEFFKGLATDQANKAEAYAGLMLELEMQEVAATAQAEQWKAKAEARANARVRLKDRMKTFMELTGQTKVTTSTGRVFAIQKNGGKQPLRVLSSNINDFPIECLKSVIDPEKVREAIEAGTVGPEVAVLEERGNHLRLK